jgi:hypothetical protein
LCVRVCERERECVGRTSLEMSMNQWRVRHQRISYVCVFQTEKEKAGERTKERERASKKNSLGER